MSGQMKNLEDIESLIKRLTLDEKVGLTSGRDVWSTLEIERLGIPSITLSDGPHGVRGTKFFNGPPAALLPSATAMGATFDTELMHRVGRLLGIEARAKNAQVLLAPTVCLQRSPLIGRGFEAFGEDPVMSGTLAASYISGLQEQGVGAAIKHYAAHDQSPMSIEDSIRMSDRTLRELHLMPFQIAIKKSNPWAVMTAYHKINGKHASENEVILDVLRKEWGWNGCVMSDWYGTYSTSEAINAGLDLEMPGPTRFRGQLLSWLVLSRKVPENALDDAVRNVLTLVDKVDLRERDAKVRNNDNDESREICRDVATQSIVLLKNEKNVLPLKAGERKSYGLIGDHFKNPAVSGGGSADLTPYYISTPCEAFVGVVGEDNVRHEIGCYSHRFSPLLRKSLHIPVLKEPGLLLEWFAQNPEQSQSTKPLAHMTTTETYMNLSDSVPPGLPEKWIMKVTTIYTAPKSMKFRFGLCVAGKARMLIDDNEVIDLWTSQPEKTADTPMFNSASMEIFTDVEVAEGQELTIVVYLTNEQIGVSVGTIPSGGLRLGGFEVIDENESIADAIELAQAVDYPVLITGLSSDWEYEGSDRSTLSLPGRVDELISRVVAANPNTIVITQSGLPIAMPWVDKTSTLLHAWFGGQETGNAITDILFGDVNPSGRLSVTFPKRIEDTPAFLSFGKADCEIYYGEGVFIGHRYYEMVNRPPLFYFGYGLSYTQFEYSDLVVPAIFNSQKDYILKILVSVKNIGDIPGADVIQIYVKDIKSSIGRPKKELKAFKKIQLQPGQSQVLELELDRYAISFWCERKSEWLAEAGAFEIIVARSADPKDEVLRKHFDLPTSFTWSGL